MKRIPRIRFVLVILAQVVVVLTQPYSAFSQLTTPTQYVFQKLQEFLRSGYDIDLRTSKVNVELLDQTVTMDGVVLQSASAPDLPPLFQAKSVYLKISLSGLIRRSLEIQTAQINSPKIHYFNQRNGRNNLPKLQASSGPTSVQLVVHHAAATDGSVQMDDEQHDIHALFPQWHLQVRGNRAASSYDFGFREQQEASVRHAGNLVPVSQIDMDGTVLGSKLQIHSARIAAADSNALITGTITGFSSPVLELRIRPDLDLSLLGRIAELGAGLSGRLSGAASISGPISLVQLSCQLRGTRVGVTGYEWGDFTATARAQWNRTAQQFTVSTLAVESPQGAFTGTAELALVPGSARSILQGKLSNFNLEPLSRRFSRQFAIASRASGSVSMHWTGPFTLSNLSGTARLRLVSTRRAPAQNILPVSGSVDAVLQNSRVDAVFQSIEALGTNLGGKIAIMSFTDITGNISGSIPEIDGFLSRVAEFVGKPKGALVDVALAGAVTFEAKASGTVQQTEITVVAEVPSLRVGRLPAVAVRATAGINPASIDFNGEILLPQNQVVLARGNLNLSAGAPVLDIDARADRIAIPAVLSMVASQVPAEGILQASVHIGGAVNSLSGSASVRGIGIALCQEPLGTLVADFRISGSRIQSTRLKLLKNPLNVSTDYVTAEAAYDLESGQYSLRVDGKDLTLRRMMISEDIPITSTLNFTASGSGTIANPSMDIKLEATGTGVRNRMLGTLSATAALRDQLLAFQASADRFGLATTARVHITAPYTASATAKLANSDLSVFGIPGLQQRPLSGVVDATLTGSGDLRNIEAVNASAEIRKLHLIVGNQTIENRGLIEASYDRGTLGIAPATIVSGDSVLQLAGTVALIDKAPPGRLTAKGQWDIAKVGQLVSVPEGFNLAGTTNLSLVLAGTSRQLDASGSLTMNNGYLQYPGLAAPMENITVAATLKNGDFILDRADASLAAASISLSGVLPLGLLHERLPVPLRGNPGPARFSAELTDFRLGVIEKLPQDVTGIASLGISGEAASFDLGSITARATFSRLTLDVEKFVADQAGESVLHLRNGTVSVGRLVLKGPESNLEFGGSAGLAADAPLDLHISGNVDAALPALFAGQVKAAGEMHIDLSVKGTRDSPTLSGVMTAKDLQAGIKEPAISATNLNVQLRLAGDRLTIEQLTGNANGGPLRASGSLSYSQGFVSSVDLAFHFNDVYLQYPQGLHSAVAGDITAKSSDDFIAVAGDVRVLESSYREPIEIRGQLLNYLRSQQIAQLGATRNTLLSRVRFNLNVETVNPLLVGNNLAKLAADLKLRLVGTYYQPSVIGRVTLDEGGQIYLNERTYSITQGSITLANQTRVEPSLDIRAETTISDYDITMHLSGTPQKMETTLTSDPPRSDADIISLLLTGKIGSEVQGRQLQMAETQALSLVAGQAGAELARGAQRTLGITTVRIEPSLIAAESHPGARLTLGEDITKNLSLAYSMNLVSPGDQIWILDYDITRRLNSEAIRQQDNTYRFQFRHELLLGGVPERTKRTVLTEKKVERVSFQGGPLVADQTLMKKLGISPGKRFNYSGLQKGIERLQSYYADVDRLEARIRYGIHTEGRKVDLNFRIDAGPKVDFAFEGMPVSDMVRKEVREVWKGGMFDQVRLDDAVAAIRKSLLEQGYLQVQVTYTIEAGDGTKLVQFHIVPGIRFTNVEIVFEGASAILPAQLRSALEAANLRTEIYSDPERVVDWLTRYYNQRGYLQARVGLPEKHLNEMTKKIQVVIPVNEGPRFLIGDINFSGNKAFSYDELWVLIPISTGSIYEAALVDDSINSIQQHYQDHGYASASVVFEIARDTEAARINIDFLVEEGEQSIVHEIVIEGNKGTSDGFVRRQLTFAPGDILAYEEISKSRQHLYSTGIYALVDFHTEEISEVQPARGNSKYLRVRINLQEIQPYRVQYGGYYDTDRGPGGVVDISNRNLLGRAADLGLRLRYDSDLKNARLYYIQPFVRRLHMQMEAGAFVQRETRVAFSANRIGFSLFQEKRLRDDWRVDYGYAYDHVRWNGLPPDPTLFVTDTPVGRITTALTRDTRNDILDATRGSFNSHSFEFGPRFLGSEIGFIRYFGQCFRYLSLDKYLRLRTQDQKGQPIPARLIYAAALRVGLSTSLGNQGLIAPERFFAGGGTTMRGFEQDLLGPTGTVDGDVRPVGGEAMLLLNNEIRFPIASVFQGVGFFDIGNVYRKTSDFSLSDLRYSAGPGLRIKTGYVLLRFDFGFKLNRRPGESFGALFFSIGQAF